MPTFALGVGAGNASAIIDASADIKVAVSSIIHSKTFDNGMICASEEVYLDKLFPSEDDHAIVDLKGIDCTPGQNIADLIGMNDTIIEIDNKSLTNRPDLWGHYGIAREIAAIYDLKIKALPKAEIDKNLPKYDIEIKDNNLDKFEGRLKNYLQKIQPRIPTCHFNFIPLFSHRQSIWAIYIRFGAFTKFCSLI